jgi:hypothetical protein
MQISPQLLFFLTVAALALLGLRPLIIKLLPSSASAPREAESRRESARPVGPSPRRLSGKETRAIMQIVVSVLVLAAALYIILSNNYDPKDKHWAYGACGTVLGFWLKI